MKAIYNSRILPIEKISLDIHNRAFCYGDGLFETIVTGPDRINLVGYHMARLTKAGGILDIEIPFDTKLLEEMIGELKRMNGLSGQTRVRVQVWRNPGGLYRPSGSGASFAMSIDKSDRPFFCEIDRLSIAKKSRVSHHALSFAKTMSAMPYVLAGLEAKQSGYDDLIILNNEGHMAETVASNLFWAQEERFYTPDLSTGCVAGTLRSYLLDQMKSKGWEVHQARSKPERLEEADSVFLTNAAGIQWVKSLEGRVTYQNPLERLRPLFTQPLQP